MDPQEMVEKGQDLFSQGFIHEAETVFNHVLANDPNNAAALNNLGVVAFNRGDSAAAERYFKQAIDIQSDYPDALLNLADLCMKTNQWQEAAGHLEQCACRHPAASLFELLAEVHAKLGHLDESEAYLKKSYQCTQEGESALDTSIPKVRICAAQTERCESQLNILFVQDSPCIRNYKTASALRSRGHRVSLAYTGKRLSQCYPGLSDDTYNDCFRLSDNRHLWDLSRNYDLVHCHNEPDILTVAALAGPTPVVHDTHDLISLRSDGDPQLSYFEGIANRGADGRIYTTPYQLEEARKLYGVNGNSLVFYNYCSAADLPQRFLPKLSAKDGRVHFVYEGGVGNSAHRDFGDVFTKLASHGIEVHIYPAAYNQEQAAYFSACPQIHYNRPVSPKKLIEEMSQFDFGIIPFNLQKGNKRFLDSTIANKLFEYLAAGLPVVASALYSYIDFFNKHPVGFTYESIEDIITRIPQLKAIAEKVDFSEYIFTFENEIKTLEEFYFMVLSSEKNVSDQRNSSCAPDRPISETASGRRY